ncbi:MAG TPA: hypothetical protein VJ761_21740 [Ktedonobacteraceae bacterium]|nr:hypothetical protein [Ktedonobacteraceae bacterium]
MDEHVQHQITQACIALLQKNAADHQARREIGVLYELKTKQEAIELLLRAGSEAEASIQNVSNALWIVYKRSKPASQTRQWVIGLLLELMQRENITASDAIELAGTLYVLSPQGSQEQQKAAELLLALAKRRDIPFTDTVEAAHTLYLQSPKGSHERQTAIEALLEQARWSDTSVTQAQEAALALSYASPYPSTERNQGIQTLIELTQRPGLSFEDAVILDDQKIVVAATKSLEKQQRAAKKLMWETVAQRSDLTAEQRKQVDEALEFYNDNL